MHLTPDDLAGAGFTVVRKGFDPDEVRAFQGAAAQALADAQHYAATMEQRAKAAVAQLHDVEQASTGGTVTHGLDHTPSQPALTTSTVAIRTDDAETISRTLLLAQRTADRVIAEATAEAAAIRSAASTEADALRYAVENETKRLVNEARAEARRTGDAERVKIESEVQALLAHLDFLREDVRELEAYADAQRQRLLEAADAMRNVAEGSVGRIADMRHPVLSPAADLPRAQHPTGAPSPVANDVLSPVSKAAPVKSGGSASVSGSSGSMPEPVSRSVQTLDLTFADAPTGESAVPTRPNPAQVPAVDDWAEHPSVRLRIVKPTTAPPSDRA